MKKQKLLISTAVLTAACIVPAPAHATNLLGISVSAANGTLTQGQWDKIATNNIAYAFCKATTGFDFSEDSTYLNNMKRGKAAGLQMGAYEFTHLYADTPSQEATYFWNFAGGEILKDGKSINPMIDFEVFSGHDGASTYTAWFNDWAADLKAKTSNYMRPVIYSDICSGMCALTTACTLSEWCASFNGENILTGSPWNTCQSCNYIDPGTGNGWTYWTSGATMTFTGVPGSFELEAFPGTLTQLIEDEGVGN